MSDTLQSKNDESTDNQHLMELRQEQRELTTKDVVAKLGKGWKIDFRDPEYASALQIDWPRRIIYCDDRRHMRGCYTFDEANGHTTVYHLSEGRRYTSEYLLGCIDRDAEEIAMVAQGYSSVWNGRDNVAVFDENPHYLLQQINDEEGGYEVWTADEWLQMYNLEELYEVTELDRSVGLNTLAEAICSEASSEDAWVDLDDVLKTLKRKAQEEAEREEETEQDDDEE